MTLPLRSSEDKNKPTFDFSTPLVTMAVLKALREQTSLDTTTKNNLRDHIFAYINGMGDKATLQIIESKLMAIGINPSSLELINQKIKSTVQTKKTKPQAGFATPRVAPTFAVFTKNDQPTELSTKQESVAKPIIQTSPQVTMTQASTADKRPAQKILPRLPVTDATTSTPATTARATTVVNKLQQTPSVSSQSAGQNQTKFNPALEATPTNQVSTPVNTPLSSRAEDIDTTPFLARIRTIKADINTKVGNPVNLVTLDKEVGKEYMSTLLGAMKQLSAGNNDALKTAMKRLEIAYEQALLILEISKQQSVKNQTPTPTPTPTPKEPSPIKSVTAKQAPTPPTPPPVRIIQPTKTANNNSQPLSPLVSTSKKVVPDVGMNKQKLEAEQNITISSSQLPINGSVATATPLRKVEELPTLSEVKHRSTNGNPLYTQEISDGLDQLLLEWSIFHKSGIFGTGPRGSEHPLFKKLASLKIPLIIVGRFEGATEEVRRSITDYMNGWRYEYGIVYEKEETFEEYLRRVIHHIIDLQDLQK